MPSSVMATTNITCDLGVGYAVKIGDGGTAATDEELMEALLDADCIPAIAIDDTILAVGEDVLIV